MADPIFICYARTDQAFVLDLADALKRRGAPVWIDQWDIPPGANWDIAIEQAIENCAYFLIVLSPAAGKSDEVRGELRMALDEGKSIVPVLYRQCSIPRQLRTIQYTDFTHGNAQDAASLATLLAALGYASPIKKPEPSAPPVLPQESPPAQQSRAGSRTTPWLYWVLGAIIVGLTVAGMQYAFVGNDGANDPEPVASQATSTALPTATTERTPSPTSTLEESGRQIQSLGGGVADPTPTGPAAGDVWINPKDGAEYAFVPAGDFVMGSDDGGSDEQPVHTVDLDEFWIMRTEVTNAFYARCVDEGACTEPLLENWQDASLADHPVTNVTWHQASDYATWAGGRLPTEAEWEKACRGQEGQTYPWGDEPPTAERLNFIESDGSGTVAVGSYPPGAYGLHDMAGNVWEWTSSQYDQETHPYPYVADDGREDPEGDAARTLRGGSWRYDADDVRCAYRVRSSPLSRFVGLGFRVVVSVSPGS